MQWMSRYMLCTEIGDLMWEEPTHSLSPKECLFYKPGASFLRVANSACVNVLFIQVLLIDKRNDAQTSSSTATPNRPAAYPVSFCMPAPSRLFQSLPLNAPGASFLPTFPSIVSTASMFSLSLIPQFKPFPMAKKFYPIMFTAPSDVITWCLLSWPIFESQLTCHHCATRSLRAGATCVFSMIHPQALECNGHPINTYSMSEGRKENIAELIFQTFPEQTLYAKPLYFFSTELSAQNKVRIKIVFVFLSVLIFGKLCNFLRFLIKFWSLFSIQ